MTRVLIRRLAVLAMLSIAGVSAAFAQLQSGRILGTVFDPQKAGIPGATVTVTNLATNIARTVTTDSEGNYVVTPLDPGTYSVSAEVPGFQTDGARGSRADRRPVRPSRALGRSSARSRPRSR